VSQGLLVYVLVGGPHNIILVPMEDSHLNWKGPSISLRFQNFQKFFLFHI